MGNAEEARAAKENLLYFALACIAKKASNRKKVFPGETRIVAHIDATVNRTSLAIDLAGKLVINPRQTTAKSVAARPAEVIAALLSEMPRAAQIRALQNIGDYFAENQHLPETDTAFLGDCETFLEKLNYQVPATKAGAIVFVPDPQE